MLGWLIGFITIIIFIFIADTTLFFREKMEITFENDVIVDIEEIMKKK